MDQHFDDHGELPVIRLRAIAALAACAAVIGLAVTAVAAPLQVRTGANLALAEVVVLNDTLPGFLQVSPNGQVVLSNAAVILGTPAAGTVVLTGTPFTNVIVTLTQAGFVCDTTYLGACTGTPTLTNLQHDFGGVITNAFCPQRQRCQETFSVGARFAFNGGNEGRWTNTITVIANYQ